MKKKFRMVTTIIYIIAMVLLTLIAIPLIKSYNNPDEFISVIDGFGVFGFIVMLLIQISQIIVAFIPGEIVEFVAGTLYGWFGGLVFCLLGIAVGQCIVFIAVRFLGDTLVERAAGSKAMTKYKFLRDEKRLKTVIFILYFLPGTPKDLLTYVVPLTKITLRDFLIISVLARIPSVVTSTLGGASFAEKDYISLAVLYGIILIISIGGMILYRVREAKNNNTDSDG